MSKLRTLDLVTDPPKKKPTREPHRIEQVFDIEFNAYQLKHYQAVRTIVGFPKGDVASVDVDIAREWLAEHRNRAQGRTTLLAMCFLEYAASNPGHRVNVFDHESTHTGQMAMMQVIQAFVADHPLFQRQVAFYGKDTAAFVFNPIRGQV